MLLALMLVVQLLCVVSGAFAVEAPDDVHHSYQAESDNSVTAVVLLDTPDSHNGCDHCSHCHAAHIGLFKPSPALPALHSEQPGFYINRTPSSPKRNIYRPPIA